MTDSESLRRRAFDFSTYQAGRTFCKVLVLFVVCFGAIAASAGAKLGGGLAQQLASAQPTDKLEVIITFQGDTVSLSQIAAVKALGINQGVVMQALPIMGVLATPTQINTLAQISGVRSLWANKRLQYFNYETRNLTGVEKLRTDPVMIQRNNGVPYSGAGVTVEVNDTGIDATHSDLQFGTHVIQNVQGATNLHALDSLLPITYIENQPDTDTAGHGTHVAGTVGGTGARSGGKYAGAAPGASLVGYGSGAVIFVLDGIGGFDYAIVHQPQQRTRIITNSFGATDPTFDPDDPLVVATYKAFKRGMVVVFAAGNEGPGVDTLNPYCKAPWVVCVGATDKQGRLTDFSSRGLLGDSMTVTEDGTSWTVLNQPTVSAPGRFIISTRASGETNSYIAGDAGADVDAEMIEPSNLPFYTVLTGTSQATPHVAGIIALMLEANPKLGPLEVKSILQQTATNIPGRAVWEAGAGLVNAYAAVDAAVRRSSADYGQTVNSLRTFNSSVNVLTNKTNFSIDYNPVISQSPTGNSFTFTVPPNTQQVVANAQAHGIQNGVQDTGNPIDMFLIAPDGTQYESEVPVAFSVFTGRSVLVDAPQPGTWRVYLQALVQTGGVDVSTIPETVTGQLYINQANGTTGLTDVTGNDPVSAAIQMAVGHRMVDGLPGGVFQASDNLLRGDMANYLVMGNFVRQFLPISGVATFADTNSPFAESVANDGAAGRDMFFQARGVMLPPGPSTFAPESTVQRYELAYSLIQSLGLQAQALQLNGQQVTVVYQGQRIPVDDAGEIPDGFAGYVQLALDLNLMNAHFSLVQGPFDLQPTIHATFLPSQLVQRAEYAVSANRFLAAFNTQ